MLLVLTGEIQIGKTRWLQASVDRLEAAGVGCEGVVAPGVWRPQAAPEDGYEKLGIDKDGFVEQIALWNADAEAGVDTQFHRGELEYETHNRYRDDDNPAFLPLVQPPFYGCVVMPAAMGTKGGIQINEKGQAVHVSGQIVPRLYACGNATGTGSPGKYYTGAGATLGAGIVFGYLAAKDAMTLDDWE